MFSEANLIPSSPLEQSIDAGKSYEDLHQQAQEVNTQIEEAIADFLQRFPDLNEVDITGYSAQGGGITAPVVDGRLVPLVGPAGVSEIVLKTYQLLLTNRSNLRHLISGKVEEAEKYDMRQAIVFQSGLVDDAQKIIADSKEIPA